MTATLAAPKMGAKSQIPWQALSPTEAAKVLGIGRTTVYEAIASADLRARKIGRSTRVDIHDLYDWFHSHSEAV